MRGGQNQSSMSLGPSWSYRLRWVSWFMAATGPNRELPMISYQCPMLKRKLPKTPAILQLRQRPLMPLWRPEKQAVLRQSLAPLQAHPRCPARRFRLVQIPLWAKETTMPPHRGVRVIALAIAPPPPIFDQVADRWGSEQCPSAAGSRSS